jgi:alpha-glucosidase
MKGIYSDQTSFYLFPEEPDLGDLVTVRLRIPKYLGKSVGNVIFAPEKNAKRYQHKSMTLYKESEYYYYFESNFNMPGIVVRSSNFAFINSGSVLKVSTTFLTTIDGRFVE